MEQFINDFFSKIHEDFLNKTNHTLKSSILPHLMQTISKNNIKYEYNLLNCSISPNQILSNNISQLEKVTKI